MSAPELPATRDPEGGIVAVDDPAARASRILDLATLQSLFGRVRRASRSHADAEDILQELLCDFVSRIANIPDGEEHAWLINNTGRYATNHYRRKSAIPIEPMALSGAAGSSSSDARRHGGFVVPMNLDPDPTEFADLNAAFQALDPVDAEIVYLRYYLGISVTEVAELTKLTSSNITTRCSRACQQIRRFLESSG